MRQDLSVIEQLNKFVIEGINKKEKYLKDYENSFFGIIFLLINHPKAKIDFYNWRKKVKKYLSKTTVKPHYITHFIHPPNKIKQNYNGLNRAAE